MALTAQDVAKLADLARIEVSEDELARLAPQLDVILASVADVASVAAEDIPPMSHAVPLENVFRADKTEASFPASQMLAGAPDVQDAQFRVPHILDLES